jgi:hypothetical protein
LIGEKDDLGCSWYVNDESVGGRQSFIIQLRGRSAIMI